MAKKQKTQKRIRIIHYYAVFDPAQEGGYNVSFPALPGCVTFGKTFEEAKKKAKEALELWLEELRAHREAIPLPHEHPIIYEFPVAMPLAR